MTARTSRRKPKRAPFGEIRKPKNARLEWKGRKLMCKSIVLAELWIDSSQNFQWRSAVGTHLPSSAHNNESVARRAVNRRFGLSLDFGQETPR